MEKSDKGTVAYLRGVAGEQRVAQHYVSHGYAITEERWCGARCEIDLIVRRGTVLVFVEVKVAKSHEIALYRYRADQAARQIEAAHEYLGKDEAYAELDIRFDLATVNEMGGIEVLENVFI